MTLKRPDGIIFDCDSTLSSIEGIDELAAAKNCKAQIAALTNQAMNGEVPLEAVYSKRLDIIRPRKADVLALAEHYLATQTLGSKALIASLQAAGIQVGIVSGGLRDAILPLAKALGIAEANVFAVGLAFDAAGNYQAVLPSPLTTAGGKREIVAQWKAAQQLKTVYLIGDGMSDVAAKGVDAADEVIGYGGVIAREKVKNAVSYFYTQADLRGLSHFWEK